MPIKKENSAFWFNEWDLKKMVHLVDQEPKKNQNLHPVWKVMKRLVHHPAGEDLPTVFRRVKGFAFCYPCKKVLSYGSSTDTLAKHVHSKSCKVDCGRALRMR